MELLTSAESSNAISNAMADLLATVNANREHASLQNGSTLAITGSQSSRIDSLGNRIGYLGDRIAILERAAARVPA